MKKKPIIKLKIVAEEEIDEEGNSSILVTLKATNRPLIYLKAAVHEQLKEHLKNTQFKDWRFVMTRDLAGNLIDSLFLKIGKEKDAWSVS